MDKFMQAAIEQARIGASEGGIPIGAALTRGDTLVAVGHNRRLQDASPIMHAEINCLHNAGGKRVSDFRGMTIYSTLMPCHMCAGAIVQFGIAKVVAGESETFDEGFDLMQRHGIEVINLDLDEPKRLLQDFMRANPHHWNADIGK